MSVEGGLGTDRAFASEIQQLRPHPGQGACASNLRRLLEGSPIVASHRHSTHAVQDPYSMRCIPQVHGAARDAHSFAGSVMERELASAVDNPVVLPDGRVESNGNFHGQVLAHASDFMGVALCGVASLCERRTAWLLSAASSRGLPPFLTQHPGLASGFMISQYAQAALVAECKLLGVPASLDSIPVSGSQEDHASMGWYGALKLRTLLERLTSVLAIEAMCAAQAIDLRLPLKPGAGTGAARAAIRERVPALRSDRELAPDIGSIEHLIREGDLLNAVEQSIGPLDQTNRAA
jgi:histidine ammonia-lyase